MDKVLELFKKDKFAKYCGIQIVEVRPGYAKCSMEITENHLNGLETLMGGATFTLADFTFSLAVNSHGAVAVALNAYISYLKKCEHGTVTAIATEISRSNKTGIYRVCITDEEGRQIAEFSGTAFIKGSHTI